MKAWILQNIGEIKYKETEIPLLKEEEVLVNIKAAGICGSDIPRIYKDGAHHMPLIPGHEFSGEIVQIGKKVEDRWLHKRVGVYPLLPCQKCIACQSGKYEMCRHYGYLGSRQNGGFAEYVAVPIQNVLELPNTVSFEQGAMLEPMAVAVHAMRRVVLKETDTVIVYGLGTIGLLLVMFLLERGIKNIFAIGNKESQKEVVSNLGLPKDNFCNNKETDVREWIKQKNKENGVDIVFECVGKNETLSQAIALATIGGTICTVGNPYTNMTLEKDIYWKILRNQLTITGTWNSSFFKCRTNHEVDNVPEQVAKVDSEYPFYKKEHNDEVASLFYHKSNFNNNCSDWEYVLDKLQEGKIAPQKLITHRFSIEDLEQGFYIMRDKTEEYIKIMMI